MPVRPIVSYVNHALYNTSKYLAKLLSPFARSIPSFVENSVHLCEILQDVTIDEDEVLVSFDVKSLYTSVPIEPALCSVRTLLENTSIWKGADTTITVDEVIELLSLCLRESGFKFRDQFYEMTSGLAMGSPVSPIVANIFMSKLEEDAMSTMSAKPKLWHRYVDDVLAIVKRASIDSTLQHLNSQHPDIAFTMEVESNGRLPYLDATIRRNGNRVTTSVHRKPTDTGRYLSFDSHHPVSAKRSTVSALLSRALSVVSDSTEQTAELDVVKSTLLKNGYPAAFIDNELARLRGKKGKQQPVLSERDSYSTTVVIPFVDKTTQAIQRVLRPLRIRVVGRPCQWKWSLQNGLKDSIDPQEDTGVVYAINCRDCEAAYIGETGRTTNVRVAEHLAHARHGRVDLSAAADHAIVEGHRLDWMSAKVIDREKRWRSRKVKEALWIRNTESTLNRDKGWDIDPLWFSLL